MKKILLAASFLFILSAKVFAVEGDVVDTTFSGNHAIPQTQSGFIEENYEVQAGKKLQRGLENTFLCFLEVSHGVKTEIAARRSEYLPIGIESFFIGAVRGFGNGVKRFGVGLYEVFSFTYAQGPILEEFDDWLI